MAVVDKYKGDDILITIGLTDSSDNSINIDNLAELYIFIVFTKTGTTAVKFSKAGTGAFLALSKVSATSYTAGWLSGDTKGSNTGRYHIEANVAETSAAYESSLKNTLASEDIVDLKESTVKSVSSG